MILVERYNSVVQVKTCRIIMRVGTSSRKLTMARQVHRFQNGVRVFDDHLVPEQRQRYGVRNVHEIEEEDVFLRLLQSIPPEGCFVNIGSAIGYYPLLAKQRSPQLTIHAIEPLEIHRNFFRDNIALNGFTQSDFILHQFGASRSDGSALLIEDRFMTAIHGRPSSVDRQLRSTVHAMLVAAGLRQPSPTTRVATQSLDSILTIIGRPVDLCQMDIQGLEFAVLQGAGKTLRDRTIDTFLIGTHGRRLHRNCAALLRDWGYRIEVDQPDPKDQPDGILVASVAGSSLTNLDLTAHASTTSKQEKF